MAWTKENDGELEQGLLSGTRKRTTSLTKVFAMGFISLASVVAFAYTSLALSTLSTGNWNGVEPVTPALNAPHEVQLDWSQYSPYFPAAPYRSPPAGCQITQVNIIQRHGARFPTSGATARIKAALAKIQAVEDYKDPRLNFLRTFTYDLGADDLVGYGAAQSFDAGQEAFARYSHLITEENIPFVRASSSDRVVQSAVNWTLGFDFASQHKYTPPVSVIISEAGNDTLDDAMCPSAGSSDPQTSAWLATYAPPITQRLNAHAPNANLTDTDTYNLISLCPFISVFKETASPFCSLFEEDTTAFPGFGYSGDLDKFYGTGYGQELGPVQGVGYINELIARLTNTPVRDNTQTNHTLDSSPKTFPLNRTLYADFSHDNQMIAIYAAMGLFRQPAPLDPTKPSPERTWKASALVPFSARMVVERLDCTIGGEAVRVLVNDAVQPLEFCGGESNDGVCSLDRFVQSQSFARGDGNGDWEKCFE